MLCLIQTRERGHANHGWLDSRHSFSFADYFDPHHVRFGVSHSEMSASSDAPVHFLQIWIFPERRGIAPGYEQKHFAPEEKRGRLRLIVSPDGAQDSVRIHQDARIHAGLFDGAEQATLALTPGRRAYVHLVRGTLHVNGTPLAGGDPLKLTDTTEVKLEGGQGAEVLVFDLPGEAAAH
ncbi:MAG: quercetin 2,3-dioxygenase [Pseudomonadota bacterium]|nr:quercetin 2,3-dioxygenase [Pseudomonadota bacterium]